MNSYLPVPWSSYNYYNSAAANDAAYLAAGLTDVAQQQPYFYNYVYDAQQPQQVEAPLPISKPQTQVAVLRNFQTFLCIQNFFLMLI